MVAMLAWFGFKGDVLNVALSLYLAASVLVALVGVPLVLASRRGSKVAKVVIDLAAFGWLIGVVSFGWILGQKTGGFAYVAGGLVAALFLSVMAVPARVVLWCLGAWQKMRAECQRAKA